jgi:Ca-activated chloride channel family protein
MSGGSDGAAGTRDELLFVKLRYKQPEGDTSRLLTVPVKEVGGAFDAASVDFKLAASTAAFGMLLRDSKHRGAASYRDVLRWAAPAAKRRHDPHGRRKELLSLIRAAGRLTPARPAEIECGASQKRSFAP